jgi:hypothetical protein
MEMSLCVAKNTTASSLMFMMESPLMEMENRVVSRVNSTSHDVMGNMSMLSRDTLNDKIWDS